MMLKNHLDLIGRNEPIQRKAKFWQSYVRALKGTDDMRAHDRTTPRPRGIFRPFLADFPELSSAWPYNKSIYDEPVHAVDRISVPGYRYLPMSREIYGYSPRNLYPAPYRPAPVYDAKKAWDDHLKRLADIDRLYPSKYPLSARHATPTPQRELTPFVAEPKDKPSYNYAGIPIWNRGGYTRRPLMELFEPVTSMPISRLTRDPWWWAYPSLRPYTLPYGWNKTPFYLRDSYLSPVKRTYLWGHHPIRPFGAIYRIRNARKRLEEKLRKIDESEELYRAEQQISKKVSLAKHESEITKIKESKAAGLPVYSLGVRRPLSDLLHNLEDTPHAKINREPWWWTYPSLRPHIEELKALPSYLRDSYLSPVKSVFHWYEHPFRPFGPTSHAFYYYLWRRTHWENELDEMDKKLRGWSLPSAHIVYP